MTADTQFKPGQSGNPKGRPKGSRHKITLAIEKNEVHGLCGFSWSSLNAQKPDWVKSGFIRVIVQEHDKGNPEINKMGVPLAVDFATSPENRKIMELIYSSETQAPQCGFLLQWCRRAAAGFESTAIAECASAP
jgi:hypothetical protein